MNGIADDGEADRSETALRSFVLMTHTHSLPSRGGKAAYPAAAPFWSRGAQ